MLHQDNGKINKHSDTRKKIIICTIPGMDITNLRQEGDTLVDNLNKRFKSLKGRDILTYYIPTDPTKEKEPLLNKTLQKNGSQRKHFTRLMQTTSQTTYANNYDVILKTEAVLQKKLPDVMRGYKIVIHEQ